MNNNGVRTKWRNKEQSRREQEGRLILRDTEGLRRELNLRLITDSPDAVQESSGTLLMPERVLYVESITVVDIRYPNRDSNVVKTNNRKERGIRLWQ